MIASQLMPPDGRRQGCGHTHWPLDAPTMSWVCGFSVYPAPGMQDRPRTRMRLKRARAAAWRVAFCAASVTTIGACAHRVRVGSEATTPSAEAKPQATAPAYVTPAHLLVYPDETESRAVAQEPDGSRRLVAHGMRLVLHADGRIDRAEEVFSTHQAVRALELPPRLGGGHLLYVNGSQSALIWRAKTWTGKLEPFANLDFEVADLVPGFDRIYAFDEGRTEVWPLDPATGAAADPGALPPSPDYGNMAFADAWLGAVEVPLRGVLVTFDAGATWRPLGRDVGGALGIEQGQLVIGEDVLDAFGRLRRRSSEASSNQLFRGAAALAGAESFVREPDEVEAEDARGTLPPAGPFGRKPLRTAVLYGWPLGGRTAVVAAGGALGHIRLRDGKLLDVAERAYPDGGPCQAVALGEGIGFVCGREGGGTVVYRFELPLSMHPVLSFDDPRFVGSSGNGALVIRGSCSTTSDAAAGQTRYCIRTRQGTLKPISITGDRGVERIVSLRDGRTVVLMPPRPGAAGGLVIIEADGSTRPVKLRLPKRDRKLAKLLRTGLWMEGFVEYPAGKLSGWVVAGGPFVGVRVGLNGKVRVGRLRSEVEHTLLAGRLALSLGTEGQALQSTNGGLDWREFDLPVQSARLFERGRDEAEAGIERGCSAVGCAFGPWVRIGWLRRKDDPQLPTPEPPPETVRSSAQGGRWNLSCAPTGEGAGPRAARRAARSRTPRHTPGPHPASGLRSTDWADFLGRRAPPKRPGQLGFDTGTEHLDVQIHGYAWGDPSSDWKRQGKWQILASDRFSMTRSVWATAVSRSPWANAPEAGGAFGQDSPANWSVALEPSGRAGVLSINNTGSRELYLIEEGRSIVPLRDAARWEVTHPAGAVKVGGAWYVGHRGSSGFRLFRVDGDRIDLLRYYPVLSSTNSSSRLLSSVVRNDAADALGIWVRDLQMRGAATRWFVYPVHPETGAVDEPVVLRPEQLGEMPPPCSEGDDGWLLEGSPPVDPYVDLVGLESVRAPRRLTARLLAHPRGLCVDSLAARAESPLPTRLPGRSAELDPHRPTVLMVMSDRARSSGRWGFRCTR